MAHISIPNETDYVFTEAKTQQIIRDAQEHVGEEVRAIRVQAGLERPVLKARTREVRYAFSPQDVGLVPMTTPGPHPSDQTADVSPLEETEAVSLPRAVCQSRRWWRCGRRGMEEARLSSGHGLCNGEERRRASARCDARQRAALHLLKHVGETLAVCMAFSPSRAAQQRCCLVILVQAEVVVLPMCTMVLSPCMAWLGE